MIMSVWIVVYTRVRLWVMMIARSSVDHHTQYINEDAYICIAKNEHHEYTRCSATNIMQHTKHTQRTHFGFVACLEVHVDLIKPFHWIRRMLSLELCRVWRLRVYGIGLLRF
jgi:hypothetical protein